MLKNKRELSLKKKKKGVLKKRTKSTCVCRPVPFPSTQSNLQQRGEVDTATTVPRR